MFIYGLIDPRTGVLRYIGKTVNLRKRFNLHLSTTRCKKKHHKDRWILGILQQGFKPEMIVLEGVSGNGDVEECIWIASFKASGVELLNIEEGGSRAKNSAETRAKISKANKGKKRSPEAIENYRAAARLRGNNRRPGEYKCSDATKAKMSKAQKKRPMTPERWAALEKTWAATRGKKRSTRGKKR